MASSQHSPGTSPHEEDVPWARRSGELAPVGAALQGRAAAQGPGRDTEVAGLTGRVFRHVCDCPDCHTPWVSYANACLAEGQLPVQEEVLVSTSTSQEQSFGSREQLWAVGTRPPFGQEEGQPLPDLTLTRLPKRSTHQAQTRTRPGLSCQV